MKTTQQLHALLDEAIALKDNPANESRLKNVISEISKNLIDGPMLIRDLESLIHVPSRYNRGDTFQVQVSLEFNATSRSWSISRDDEAGGGPYRRGPRAGLPEEATRGFVKMESEGRWSPEE